jgi:hypothetical protein
MSEENQSPEESTAKKPRKAAAPRAKKAVKAVKAEKAPAKPARDTSGLPDVPQTPSEESRRAPEPEPQEAPRVEIPRVEARRESPQAAEDSARSGWPEVETIQGGNQLPTSGKRKRRRKKKGGQGGQAPAVAGSLEVAPLPPRPPQSQPRREVQEVSEPVEASVPRQQGPRVQLDLDDLAEKAWKIFQSEVAEEGMALIGDQDARELSRKSFRLAEIFLEEQSRRIR